MTINNMIGGTFLFYFLIRQHSRLRSLPIAAFVFSCQLTICHFISAQSAALFIIVN